LIDPQRSPAILLLGPTGSGKTPLGELIEARGLGGARCLHFDFGANLRQLVERGSPEPPLTVVDIEFLRGILRIGALLEDEHFPLAAAVLRSFLARRGAEAGTVVVLNGLPRHPGQAEALEPYLDVRQVVRLACSGETALDRIRSNVGGDRAGREDDDLESVRAKLAIFAARTEPLLAHYRARGTPIETVRVTSTMRPEDVWHVLSAGRTGFARSDGG
jgi:adenylate kinase